MSSGQARRERLQPQEKCLRYLFFSKFERELLSVSLYSGRARTSSNSQVGGEEVGGDDRFVGEPV